MTVAIIGTGRMGSALGRRLTRAETPVILASRVSAEAAALVRELGEHARTGETSDIARAADIVVLAVPYNPVADVPSEVGDLSGKVVVDIYRFDQARNLAPLREIDIRRR